MNILLTNKLNKLELTMRRTMKYISKTKKEWMHKIRKMKNKKNILEDKRQSSYIMDISQRSFKFDSPNISFCYSNEPKLVIYEFNLLYYFIDGNILSIFKFLQGK